MTRIYKQTQLRFWKELSGISGALLIHIFYLFHTYFVDWPEMVVYPWLHSKGLAYYRDITIPFPPGMMWILSPFYHFLGFSVQTERIIAYFFILLTDILIYFAVREITKRRWVPLLSLLFFILWQPVFYGNSLWHETVLAPIFVGLFILMNRYFQKPTRLHAVLIGLLFAGATLIKQTVVWPLIVVCLFVWLSDKDKKQGFVNACRIGAISLVVSLTIWGHYWLFGLGSVYGFWVYGFPFTLTKASSYYAIIPTRGDIAYIFAAFLPLALLPIISKKRLLSWFVIAMTIALIPLALPRWGIFRLTPALALASIGFGLMLSDISAKLSGLKRALVITVLLVAALLSWRSSRVFITTRDRMQPQFFGADYEKLLAFGKEHLDKPFFVLGNYDYLYIGLNARPVVLPWTELLPWNAELPGVQNHIIASLDTRKVPYILYIPYHPNGQYYMDYKPAQLMLYLDLKYAKIAPLPVSGGWLYKRL